MRADEIIFIFDFVDDVLITGGCNIEDSGLTDIGLDGCLDALLLNFDEDACLV